MFYLYINWAVLLQYIEMAAAAEMCQEDEVAGQSQERAEAALLEGQYSKAFTHYMLLIRLQPAKKPGVYADSRH